MIDLKGAFTALVSPFDSAAAAVDLDRLAEQIRFQAAGGVAGVVPCGTTGESPTLAEAEHRAVIERTVEIAHEAGLLVIAGAGSNCTAHALQLHRFAWQAGADASLQVVPYYNKPTQEGLHRHFCTIADAADLPVVLYNIPSRTGVGLTIETIRRLSGHPNIVAIKEATGSLDLASEIAAQTDLTVLSGDDSLTLPIAAVGGRGVVSVLSNLLPGQVEALCRATLTGAWQEALAEHRRLLPLARGLLSLATNPIPVKTAMRILGRDSGAMRLPLCPPDEPTVAAIGRLVESAGLRSTGVAV